MAAIETDAFLPHEPSKVWRALTDPRLLERWLMPNDFLPQIGRRFTFQTEPRLDYGFDGIVHCEVLALDLDRLLAISWRTSAGLDTTVTWKLAAEGRGTRLFLTHDGFDETDPFSRQVMEILGGGWRGHLKSRLDAVLADIDPADQAELG